MSAEPAEPRRLEEQLRQLEPIAEQLARRYYLPGADRDDVHQLAMIGLWQALKVWDGVRPIEALAWTIAERRVLEAVKSAGAEKRRAQREALTVAVNLEGEVDDLLAELPAPASVERLAELRAELRAAISALERLTPLERRSLLRSLAGERYWDHAAEGDKSADNACQRARVKLRAAVAAERAA